MLLLAIIIIIIIIIVLTFSCFLDFEYRTAN